MSRLPPTMLLQIAVAALATAIGVLALRIPRLRGVQHVIHARGWSYSGAAFLLMGLCGLAQCAFGSMAILSGSGSAAWTAFLRWAPALNHSRNGVELALVVALLLLLPRGGRMALDTRAATGLLIAGLAAGAAVGWAEGSLTASGHYSAVAVADVALFAAWALLLGASVLADTVDRWLLLALALWAAPLPLNALWFFWLARAESGVWTPRPVDMQLYRLALHLAVLAAAVHRWRLGTRGLPVTGIAGHHAASAPQS